MRFQILSHAGMMVEESGVSLLFDPWLIGSCYWRSWWNFPEPDRTLVTSLKPNYIYLTHLHWDHFHGPSLKLFDPATTFLVPKLHTRRMVDDLNDLGFKNVIEIPHGSHVTLGDDFELYSYQFGPCADSAAVVKTKTVTLLNANDSKFFGLPLKQIIDRFEKFDFVFRSHSSATAIPYCIDNYSETYAEFRTAEDYMNDFAQFSLFLKTRYAIPFASNHCFLHKETYAYNKTSVTPYDAQRYYQQQAQARRIISDCVVMPPGSTWDEHQGFNLEPFDYQNKFEYVDQLQEKYANKLNEYYEQEQRALAHWNYFTTYFSQFLQSIPWFIRRKKDFKVCFNITDNKGTHYWLIDFNQQSITQHTAPVDSLIEIECAARIINDCVRKKMFSVWTASKRLKIKLAKKENLKDLQLLFTLLDLYELDYLPLMKNVSFRHLGVTLRRWREFVEYARVLLNVKVFKKAFSLTPYYQSE